MFLLFSIFLSISFAGPVLGAVCCTTACAACNICVGFIGAGFALACFPTCMLGNPLLVPCACGGAWTNVCLVAEVAPTI